MNLICFSFLIFTSIDVLNFVMFLLLNWPDQCIFCSVHYREFVNSVWCIKILSLQELQQMGKRGLELLNSVPVQKLSNSGCENYVGPQESRNLSPGIASVGSLDY